MSLPTFPLPSPINGIYIHIPFCKQACHYCDFHFSTSLEKKSSLLEAIAKEIVLRKNYFSSHNTEIKSIYFGGGTPSLLSEKELMQLFESLHRHFNIHPSAEITLEANPDDLTTEKLKELKNTPVNRFSIGIQSFSDEDLRYMNRAHNATHALACIRLAQDAGFTNISADLIYGTPTLSHSQWKKNLTQFFSLGIQHLSSYCLTVEPETPLAHLVKKGTVLGVEEERSAEQFETLMQMTTEAGYVQYEISNFCHAGSYSRHNTNYWMGGKYLGLGPSAHSYDGISRQKNIANNAHYITSIENGNLLFETEELTPANRFNEYVMTSLRTMWGCDPEKILQDFGRDIFNTFSAGAKKEISAGTMVQEKEVFHLTTKGKLIADSITSSLLQI